MQSINFLVFLVVENHCVLLGHILILKQTVRFFPRNVRKNAKRRPQIITDRCIHVCVF